MQAIALENRCGVSLMENKIMVYENSDNFHFLARSTTCGAMDLRIFCERQLTDYELFVRPRLNCKMAT